MILPYVIAEIASAHEGRPDLALRIAGHAVNAGANAVKFQIFNRDQLLSKSNPYFNEFGQIELSPKQWQKILRQISYEDVEIIIEPYDMESFILAEKTGVVNGYKIPASSIGETDLLEVVKQTRKSVYLGVGGAERNEIEKAVAIFENSDITLLCGFQNFPTKLKDSKLYQIHQLKKTFGCAVGYADHVDAEDQEMTRLLPSMMVGAGATVIEKHITNDRTRKGRDYYSALNPDEFKSFIRLMHSLPNIIGEEKEWSLSEAEMKYRKFTKRQAVVARDIAIGEKLNLKDVVFKRTNEEGLSYKDISEYAGREIVRSKKTDDSLTREDFVES